MATIKILTLPGEEVTTTFWNDFTIADKGGIPAIRDTFERAFTEWKGDYRYLTNLVLTLNHKSWDFYDVDNDVAEVYVELFEKAQEYALTNLKGKELDYYYRITD